MYRRYLLLCFDLLTRPKMPFKVTHRKEVIHSNGSYERKSRGRKLADEMGRGKKKFHYTLNCMTVISARWRLHRPFQASKPFRTLAIKREVNIFLRSLPASLSFRRYVSSIYIYMYISAWISRWPYNTSIQLYNSQCITSPTWSCLVLYSFASLLRSLIMWLILSFLYIQENSRCMLCGNITYICCFLICYLVMLW